MPSNSSGIVVAWGQPAQLVARPVQHHAAAARPRRQLQDARHRRCRGLTRQLAGAVTVEHYRVVGQDDAPDDGDVAGR